MISRTNFTATDFLNGITKSVAVQMSCIIITIIIIIIIIINPTEN